MQCLLLLPRREQPRSHDGFIGAPVACRSWVVDSENHDGLLPIGATGKFL